jgi:hypothetical protein
VALFKDEMERSSDSQNRMLVLPRVSVRRRWTRLQGADVIVGELLLDPTRVCHPWTVGMHWAQVSFP